MKASRLTVLLLACNLYACALHDVQHDDPPVEPAKPEPAQPATPPVPENYVVRSGDTLYAIAWEQGLDYKELAAWNHIAPPYTIYPGQTISLKAGVLSPARPDTGVTTAPATPLAEKPAESEIPDEPMPSPGRYQTENRKEVESARAEPTVTRESTPEPATPPATQVKPVPPPAKTASGDPVWIWPTDGTVTSTFTAGDSSRQGVDIRGREGQSVLAAAAGEVVYSGNGLIGYGELIIIKHDETWLSAYGNNRRRKVTEGISVSAGQAIAEMGQGQGNGDHAELHFEIRRKGKPVDPLRYLPGR